MFGDGAANQGTFGETLNIAALWKLPVVFMVTNNQFGMGTALERHTAQTDLHKRGEGFGVPGMRCDGMDVLDTYKVMREAIEKVREERQPILVEAVTYRFRGHSMADPEEYRSKEQVKEWREKDPIPNFAEQLDVDLDELDKAVTERIDEAVSFADDSAFPPPESLYDHIYVLDDQAKGWYTVDERASRPQKGEALRDAAADEYDEAVEQSGAGRRGERRTPTRPEDETDGRDALPRGAQRRPARGDGARRVAC